MACVGERLHEPQEGPDLLQKLVKRVAMVIAGDGVMQLLAHPLDAVDTWMPGRLKKQFEFWIAGQPPLRETTLMDDVDIGDEYQRQSRH